MTVKKAALIAITFQAMLHSTRPLLSLYAAQLGAGTWEIGLLTAAFAFFPFVLAIHIGRMTDAAGDRLPVILGMMGLTAGVALPFLVPSLGALYLSQMLVGVSQIFAIISLQNIVGSASTKENRDHHFGMYSTAIAAGGLVGPVLGGHIAEAYSYPAAFLTAACIGLAAVGLAFRLPSLPRARAAEAPRTGSPLQLLRIPLLRRALASSALVLYSRDIFVAYFPLLASGQGLSPSEIGWIISLQGLAMVLIRSSLGRLTQRFGRDRILLVSIVTAGAAFLLVPLSAGLTAFALLSALIGAGLGCGQPLSMATTYNVSPKNRSGEVLGLRLACNRMAQLAAPLFFGLLGSGLGILAVFYVSGAFLLGGAFLTRARPGEPLGEEEAGAA